MNQRVASIGHWLRVPNRTLLPSPFLLPPETGSGGGRDLASLHRGGGCIFHEPGVNRCEVRWEPLADRRGQGTWRASAICTASSRTGASGLTGTQARPRRWPVKNTSGSSSSSTAPSQAPRITPNLNSGLNRRASSWASRTRSAEAVAAPSKCSTCRSRPRWVTRLLRYLSAGAAQRGGEGGGGRKREPWAIVGSCAPTLLNPLPKSSPLSLARRVSPTVESLWSFILKRQRTSRDRRAPRVLAPAQAAWAFNPGSGGASRPRAGPLSRVLCWAPGACPAFATAQKGHAGTPAARSHNRRIWSIVYSVSLLVQRPNVALVMNVGSPPPPYAHTIRFYC